MVIRKEAPERPITDIIKQRAWKFAEDVVQETYDRLHRNIET